MRDSVFSTPEHEQNKEGGGGSAKKEIRERMRKQSTH